jgi:hypothetical protein
MLLWHLVCIQYGLVLVGKVVSLIHFCLPAGKASEEILAYSEMQNFTNTIVSLPLALHLHPAQLVTRFDLLLPF